MNTTFTLHPIVPFRLDYTVFALRRRNKNIVDLWDGKQYLRLLIIENEPVKVAVVQKNESQICVTVNKNLNNRAQDKLTRQLEKLLGLNRNLQNFYQLAKQEPILNSLVSRFIGLKPPQFPSIFEALVNAISCQRISLDAGLQIQNRLVMSFGKTLNDRNRVLYAFPSPYEISNCSISALKKIGYSTNKSKALIDLASAMIDEAVFAGLTDKSNDEVVSFLCHLPGIGRWSAEYVLLRGLGRVEVFPSNDVGAQNSLYQLFHLDSKPDYKKIAEMTAKWYPYAGLVYFHLLLHKLVEKGAI